MLDRRFDLEEELERNYIAKMNEVFGIVDVSASLPEIYIVNSNEDNLIGSNEQFKGRYLKNKGIALIRNGSPFEIERTVSVHESIHHNLHALKKKYDLLDRDIFIEEGTTEFLTKYIMDDDYTSKRVVDDDISMTYKIAEKMFEKIFNTYGLEEVLNAYLQCKNVGELLVHYPFLVGVNAYA